MTFLALIPRKANRKKKINYFEINLTIECPYKD